MKAKLSPGLLGGLVSLIAIVFLIVFGKRRWRWGMFFLRLLVATGERWRDGRDQARIRSLKVLPGGPGI